MLTLLIVDDHEVVREGLSAMLDRRPRFQVVAEAGTVAEAIDAAQRFQPDLVVMDVRLPDGSGVEACREIRAELPDTRVVMLTSYPDEEAVIAAIIAGASGYLLKQVRARDLVAALEAVGRGESLLDPAVTGKVLERMRRIATSDQPDELAALTQQERKILALVAEGKTNKEIAADVFLSDKTVKNYVSSILAKLNLERRAQAAAYVARPGPTRTAEIRPWKPPSSGVTPWRGRPGPKRSIPRGARPSSPRRRGSLISEAPGSPGGFAPFRGSPPTSVAGEPPQHGRQDAALAVVVDLDRPVEARDRAEASARPPRAGARATVTSCRGPSPAEARGCGALAAGQPERRRALARQELERQHAHARRGWSGGCARSSPR